MGKFKEGETVTRRLILMLHRTLARLKVTMSFSSKVLRSNRFRAAARDFWWLFFLAEEGGFLSILIYLVDLSHWLRKYGRFIYKVYTIEYF